MRSNHGQIMPFCMLMIAILIFFIISNFEIGFLNFRKIQQQKKMDGIAMHYATDYARGLNALAALNQALVITSQRGYMMAGVYTALAACTAFTGICAKQFVSLSIEIVPFYKKLNKLGKSLARQQEGIIKWMIQSRCSSNIEMLTTFENFHLYPELPCTLQSNFEGLPFYRPDETATENIEGVEDCKTQEFTSYNQFDEFTNTLSDQLTYRKVPRFDIRYESEKRTVHHERPKTIAQAQALTASMQKRVGDHYENFGFRKAIVQYCTKFTELFGELTHDLPFVFDIPAPLVFKDDFFQHGNKMIFIASNKIDSGFKKIQPQERSTDSPKKVWGMTEILIDGDNFRKMKFKPRIDSISLNKELWISATTKRPWVGWPNLITNEHEILH
jgi:hypothetical protein